VWVSFVLSMVKGRIYVRMSWGRRRSGECRGFLFRSSSIDNPLVGASTVGTSGDWRDWSSVMQFLGPRASRPDMASNASGHRCDMRLEVDGPVELKRRKN